MKNIVKNVIVLISLFLSQACSLDIDEIITSKILDSISIDSSNAKKTYYIGEEIDTSNIIVYACYTDGSKEKLPKLDKTNFEFDTTDKQQTKIKVSYIGKTGYFPITMSKKPINRIIIERYPSKRIYSLNDIKSENYKNEIANGGIVVKECYEDGTIGGAISPLDENNPIGYELTASVGNNLYNDRPVMIEVSFGNLTANFDVFVSDELANRSRDYELTATLNNNYAYKFKIDKIDSSNIIAKCTSKNNQNDVISIPYYCLNIEDITLLEKLKTSYEVSVSLSEELSTKTNPIEIIGELDGLNLEKKTEYEEKYYYVGDSFDNDSIRVYETWKSYKNEDGSSINGTEIKCYEVEPKTFTQSGLNTVTIKYNGHEKNLDIFVNAKIPELKIENPPEIPLGTRLEDFEGWKIRVCSENKSFGVDKDDCNFEYVNEVNTSGKYDVKVTLETNSCFYAYNAVAKSKKIIPISTTVTATVIDPELSHR